MQFPKPALKSLCLRLIPKMKEVQEMLGKIDITPSARVEALLKLNEVLTLLKKSS